ncbi:hypothetical protein [Thermonema rossianum]|uniref:hypothetical protein n=1 Tax=Thermonema rossianum TaxID=55505 RepID=UPI00056FAC13|nr:hypothetical protein [Thermonema rossianum]
MKTLPFIPELLSDEESRCLYGGFSECLAGGGHATGTNDKACDRRMTINWGCVMEASSSKPVKGQSTHVKDFQISFFPGDSTQQGGMQISYDSAGVRKKLVIPLVVNADCASSNR